MPQRPQKVDVVNVQMESRGHVWEHCSAWPVLRRVDVVEQTRGRCMSC